MALGEEPELEEHKIEDKQEPPWSIGDAVIILFCWIFFSSLVSTFIDVERNIFSFFLFGFLQALILVALVIIVATGLRRGSLPELGLRFDNFLANLGLGIIGYAVIFLAIVIGATIIIAILAMIGGLLKVDLIEIYQRMNTTPPLIKEIISAHSSPLDIAILLIVTSLFAPISEELFLRGMVYPALKVKVDKRMAMFLSALIFAAMHLNIFAFIPLTILGIGLAYLYERTGSLLSPMVVHSLQNIVATMLILGSQS